MLASVPGVLEGVFNEDHVGQRLDSGPLGWITNAVTGERVQEFEVEGDPTSSRIHQTTIFDPVGLWGQLYWYALYPLHGLIFTGMLHSRKPCVRRRPR